MTTMFPFGFPGATAIYLSLYVLTLVVHVLFMNYVLAGSLLRWWWSRRVASRDGAGAQASSAGTIVADVLEEWTPFAVSGAITAGVGPLLFVQLLYKTEFYSANLLLVHRWMAILPVLIVAFYLLYVARSAWTAERPRLRRAIIALIAILFVFVAWSWTENHLLSMRPRDEWAKLYGTGTMWFPTLATIPRVCLWVFGAFPVTATLLVLQLSLLPSDSPFQAERRGVVRALATAGLVGLAGSVASAIAYSLVPGASLREGFTGPMGLPWLAVTAAGVIHLTVTWTCLVRAPLDRPIPRVQFAVGLVLVTVGATALREVLRITSLGATRMDGLVQEHGRIWQSAGGSSVVVFSVSVAIGVANISGCIGAVRRALGRSETRRTTSRRP